MPKTRSRWFLVGGIAFLALAVPLAISSLLFSKETEAWFDPGYGYRKRIDVTNGSGSDLTDYQVKITFDSAALISAGKMQSDCDDIRVTGRNGQVLPYWIETGTNGCNTATTAVWIKTTTLPSSGGTVYFYYGNPGAVSAQNGNEVFILFDDFSQDEGWLKIDGTLAYSSGEMTYTPGSGGTWKHNTTTTQDAITGQSSYVVEHRYKATSLAGGTVFRYVDDNNWWGLEIFSGVIKARGFVGGSDTSRSTASFAHSNNTYYNLKTSYDVSSHTYKVYVNDTLYITDTLSGAQQFATTNRVGVVDHAGYGPSTSDWVFVRKFATTDPGLSFASEEVAPGPIAHWKFDEGQGQTINNSGGGSTGTLGANASPGADDPVWVSDDQCVSGKCLRFDGSDDLVDSGRDFSWAEGESYSIGAWAKTNSLSAEQAIFGKINYEYSLGVSTAGVVRYNHWSSGGSDIVSMSSSTTVSPNTWYFIQITKDASSAKMYINGELVATDNSVTGTYMNQAETLKIGRSYLNITGGTTRTFNGFIDEVKVYPYARTAEQVRQDYNQGSLKLSGGAGFLGEGLVGYWKMDESSWNGTAGEVKDSSGNGIHGAVVNGAAIGIGKFGNSGVFDGTDDRIEGFSNRAALNMNNKSLTVSAWLNTSSYSGYSVIVDKGSWQGWGFVGGGFIVNGPASDQSTTCYFSAPTGTWVHLVGVLDATNRTITCYTNGVLAEKKSLAIATDLSAINGSTPSFGIGARQGTSSPSYPGSIDEVRIYNRALSQSEVTNLYNYAPGPIAHWNFDEGTGTAVADTSGGNNGVLTNGPTWTTGKLGKALTFDGTNDYTEHGDVLDMGVGDRTISFWLKTTLTGDLYALSKSRASPQDYRYAVGINTGRGKIFMKGSGGSDVVLTGSKVISDGNWHYMTYIFDRDQNASIYVDGQYDAQASISTWNGQDFQSNNPFRIGTYTASNNVGVYGPFNGSIDDVRIYNYVRTPAQIQEDMSGNVSLGVTGAALPDPVAYYKLDEQVGQTVNNSGSGGSGMSGVLGVDTSVTSDDPSWKLSANCKVNGCMSFDDATDKVEIANPNVIGTTTSFTITTWLKMSSAGTQALFGEFNSNGTVTRNYVQIASGLIRFDQYPPSSGYITSNSTVNDNQWHHIAYTQEGTKRAIYIDGKLDISDSNAETYSGSAPTVTRIGYRGSSYSERFNGLIDEFKIYNTPLTQDQIFQDMNAGSAMDFGSRAAPEANLLSDGAGTAPIAEWKFDEKQGTVANDTSGNGYNGTLTNSPTWKSGCQQGACLEFNGSNSYVATTLPSQSFNNASFSLWFKSSNAGSIGSNSVAERFITQRSAPGSTRLAFGLNNDKISAYWNQLLEGTTVIVPNKWYHAELVYDGSFVRLYLNGHLENSASASIGSGSTDGVNIGSLGTSRYFGGQIDHVKIYNYARTPAQIAYDYNRGAPLAHWKLDECEGTTIHDSSGNGLHGTLTVGGTGSQTSAGTCSVGNTAWGNGASGKYGASLNFDGTDDYVSMGDDNRFTFSSDFSVAFWMKPKSGGTSFFWGGVSKAGTAGNREWEIGFDPTQSDAVRFLIGDNMGAWTTDVIRGAGLTRNEWHHVVGVVAGGQVKIYIDGKQSGANGSYPSTLKNTTSPVYVGGVSGYETQSSFNGPIDDVRIYNYALSPAQVAQVMNEGAAMRFGE